MKIGYAIITFVITHFILRAIAKGDEVLFYFWPTLLAVGVYLIV